MGGPLPIAISEILAWADYNRITDDDDRDRLLTLIKSMDNEWLTMVSKKEKQG